MDGQRDNKDTGTRAWSPSVDAALEVGESKPLTTAVLGMDDVSRWRRCAELVVSEEVESDRAIIKRTNARRQELDEG